MKQLIEGYTAEDLSGKIESEGLEYFLLHYLDTDKITCEDFKEDVIKFRNLYDDIIETLEYEGVEFYE